MIIKRKHITGFYFLILITFLVLNSCNNRNDSNKSNKEQKSIIRPEILSFSELEKIDYELPYILELKNNSKHLIMYGCRHSFNPTDTMLLDIQSKFEKMKPDFAFNEGGNWPIFESRNETVMKSGEQGFLRFLCKKDSVPVRSYEPQPINEYEYLISKFEKDDVLLMYFCRQIAQIQNNQAIKDFKGFLINDYLTGLKNSGLPIDNPEKEYQKISKNYEVLFGNIVNTNEFNPENVLPIFNKTILNEINRTSVNFRDLHIVNEIKNVLEKNDKVFVLIGGSHVIKQEKLIKYYFEEINKSH